MRGTIEGGEGEGGGCFFLCFFYKDIVGAGWAVRDRIVRGRREWAMLIWALDPKICCTEKNIILEKQIN